jgi:3,4-dihydroxy 2-butanone 4-phosphate synthase/GTP cyclohydrolase II
MPHPSIDRVLRAIEEIREGRMVILVDDEDRENEGDLAMAAQKVTPEAVNFMARFGRGLICLSLTEERCRQLGLPMMVDENTSRLGTAFTVSIEARHGVTTGISAHDRATTIRTAISDDCRPEDLVRPGHVFPLRARNGGVLVRTGQTEGSVDLARLAGLKPAGVICEIMRDDGQMARMPDLERFAAEHGLCIVTIADIINYRLQRESLVHRVREAEVTNEFGPWRSVLYRNDADDNLHLALVRGEILPREPVLVRVHSGCVPGEVLGLDACKCREKLWRSMERIAAEGRGVVLYLQHERAGAALLKLFDAHILHRAPEPRGEEAPGAKPVFRDYGIGVQILRELGVRRMRLLSDHDRLLVAIEGHGLEVVERVPLDIEESTARLLPLPPKRSVRP